MLENYSTNELLPLVGHEVVDANGKSIGFVDLLFADDETGRPEWIGIWLGGRPGEHRALAPIRGAELVEDELRLPSPEDVVKTAPTYDEEDDRGLFADDSDVIGISPEKERAAYEHYGIEPLTTAPAGKARPRFRAIVVDVRLIGEERPR